MKLKKIVSMLLVLLINFSIFSSFNVYANDPLQTQIIVSNCDATWSEGPVNIHNKVQGIGAIGGTAQDGVIFNNSFTPLIVTLPENKAALSLWIYIDDISNISDAAIELSSSGKSDIDEYQWGYNSTLGWIFDSAKPTLNAGWNKLILPFNGATKNGVPDIGNLDYMRAYVIFNGLTKTVLYDDIKIISVPTQMQVASCDTAWTINGQVNTAYKKSGIGSIGGGSQDNIILANTFAPINVTLSDADAALGLWMYLDDVSGLQDAAIEINSGGSTDIDEYQWGYNSAIGWHFDGSKPRLKAGWNYVVLPFVNAVKNGTPDKSSLKYMRVYFIFGGLYKNVFVDDIKVIDISKTIKTVITPVIQTIIGTNFANIAKPSTVDIITYSGTTTTGIPVKWNKSNYQSGNSDGCMIEGEFSYENLVDRGIIDNPGVVKANIVINNETEVIPSYKISNCDITDFDADIDNNNKAQGSASVSKTQTGAGLIIFEKSFTPVNANITEQNGALDLWVYIEDSDATIINGGNTQIELNSGASSNDTNEYNWGGLANINLKNGWNRLILKLSEASKSGTVDINSIGYFRYYTIFNSTNVTNTIKIDNVQLIDWTQLVNEPVGLLLDSCDSSATETGWSAQYELNLTNYKEGTAAFQSVSPCVISKAMIIPVNLDVTEYNGAISMWIYLSNINLPPLGQFQIELSSSGGPDVNEYSWKFEQLNPRYGWNKVTLYFSDAGKNGNPDLGAINWFRLYDVSATNRTILIDDIRIIKDYATIPVSYGNFKVIGTTITNIAPDSTKNEITIGMTLRDDTTLEFNNLAVNDKVGTGTNILVIVDTILLNNYTIIVYGDVNGDAGISIADLALMKKHILKSQFLIGVKLSAGDISKDGVVSISDLIAVKQHLLNIVTISQS